MHTFPPFQLTALRAIVLRLPGENSAAGRIRTILTRLEKECEALCAIMTDNDPMVSAVAHDLRVDAGQARLRGMLATARPELAAQVSNFRNQHEAARLAKAQLKPDQYAEEIRSVFRNLSIADKNAFMAEAIQTKDNATVAALVTVPAVISGMPAEQAAGYKEAYLRAVAGESGEPIALELEAVCNTFLSVAESLAMPDSFARADGVPRPAAPPASAYQTPGAPPAVAA